MSGLICLFKQLAGAGLGVMPASSVVSVVTAGFDRASSTHRRAGQRNHRVPWFGLHGEPRCILLGVQQFSQSFVVANTILAGIIIGYTIVRSKPTL